MFLEFIIHFGGSFLVILGFSVLFNLPKKAILPAGFTAATGWTIYHYLFAYFNVHEVLATVVAAFIIAFISQIFARRLKTPVIIFTLPGLISLFPGEMAYNMMLAFVEGETVLGLQRLTTTFMTAGAIALGLAINGAVFQLFSPHDLFKRGKKYVP